MSVAVIVQTMMTAASALQIAATTHNHRRSVQVCGADGSVRVASQIVNVDAAIKNDAAQHCFLGVHLTNDFHISAAPVWVADGFTDEESIEFGCEVLNFARHAVGSLLVLLPTRPKGGEVEETQPPDGFKRQLMLFYTSVDDLALFE